MEALTATEEARPSQRWAAEGMRASLSAVREAQADALARNRRETLKARLLVGTAVVTFAVGLVATRTSAARKVPLKRSTVAASVAPAASAPAIAPPAVAAPIAAAPLAAPPLEAPAPTAVPEAASADGAANAEAVATCERLNKRHHWREAAEPCAAAVKARPNDATIVLALAQSEHARNRLAEAGQWATRAIALDPSLAEAFIIQAHAETRAGNAGAAARDFRRYLSLAPRGWHAREARAALRAREDE